MSTKKEKKKKENRKGEGIGGNERDTTIILFISIVKHGYENKNLRRITNGKPLHPQ